MRLDNRIRPLLALGIFFVLVFVLGRFMAAHDDSRNPFYVRFELYGTFGEMILYHEHQAAGEAAEAVLTTLQELHRRFNNYSPDSELSRLNARAFESPVACSDALWEILQEARRGYALTDGAFDITVGPLMQLWGFHDERDQWPSEADIAEARSAVGLDTVLFDAEKRSVRFTHPETRIDLGGIAKGYALDRAAEILRQHNIRRGLINLGGNIRTLDPPYKGRNAYSIGLRNPLQPDSVLGRVQIKQTSVATSGGYEKYRIIGDRRVSHVIDPRSGYPVNKRVGATVITGRGVDSDMFSTAVLVGGESVAQRVVSALPRTRIILTEATAEGEGTHIKVNWEWAASGTESWPESLWRRFRGS